jgi:hypothetical protein
LSSGKAGFYSWKKPLLGILLPPSAASEEEPAGLGTTVPRSAHPVPPGGGAVAEGRRGFVVLFPARLRLERRAWGHRGKPHCLRPPVPRKGLGGQLRSSAHPRAGQCATGQDQRTLLEDLLHPPTSTQLLCPSLTVFAAFGAPSPTQFLRLLC